MDTLTTTDTNVKIQKPTTTVVVVRHGERLDYVVRDKGDGGKGNNWIESHQDAPWDPPLTSHGHQQATHFGKSLHSILSSLSIPADASSNITSVYSSPFLRCRQTSAGIIEGLSSSIPDLQLKVKVEYGLSESLNESWYRSWSIPGTDGTWAYRKKDLPNPDVRTLHPAAQLAVQPLLHDWKNKKKHGRPQRDSNAMDVDIDNDNLNDLALKRFMDMDHESITTIDVPYSYATKTFESQKTQRRRMHDTLNTLAKLHPGETIILVSHGGPVTHLYESLTGNHWDTHGEPKYCSYSIYQQDEDEDETKEEKQKNIIIDITPGSTKTDDTVGSNNESTAASSDPNIKWTPLVVNQQASDTNQDGSDGMLEEAAKKIEKIKAEAAAVAAAAASDSSRADLTSEGHANVSVAANESLCQECKSNLAKYQCPKCCHRTCSLECCRNHKQRTKCSGKRQRAGTEFLPLSRMDDNTLKNDYFFLEEVLEQIPRASKVAKQASSAKIPSRPPMTNDYPLIKPASSSMTVNKIKNSHGSNGTIIISNGRKNTTGQQHQQNKTNYTNQAKRDKMCRRLEQNCDVRGIKLQIMPNFMERHKQNTSWYSNPLDRITWMVEVFLVVAEEQQQEEQANSKQQNHHQRIVLSWSEDADLKGLVTKVLDASPSYYSSSSSSSPSYSSHHLFMKRLPCPASNPKYIDLLNCSSDSMSDGEPPDDGSVTITFRTALKGHTIIEYPTLYCVHQSQAKNYPLGTNQITVE